MAHTISGISAHRFFRAEEIISAGLGSEQAVPQQGLLKRQSASGPWPSTGHAGPCSLVEEMGGSKNEGPSTQILG